MGNDIKQPFFLHRGLMDMNKNIEEMIAESEESITATRKKSVLSITSSLTGKIIRCMRLK